MPPLPKILPPLLVLAPVPVLPLPPVEPEGMMLSPVFALHPGRGATARAIPTRTKQRFDRFMFSTARGRALQPIRNM